MMCAFSAVGRAVSQSQRNRYYLFKDIIMYYFFVTDKNTSDMKSISALCITDNKKILICQFVWWVWVLIICFSDYYIGYPIICLITLLPYIF